MPSFLRNARFASVLAVGALLFAAGLATGANGAPFILGVSTNTATATTKLSTNFNGNAFAVSQTNGNATANGIRGDSSAGSGGVFTSTSNNALFGLAASANRFGVIAKNSGAAGTGGGLFADGGDNNAIVATSANTTAIVGTATGCTGLFCGATGVVGSGAGFFGSGVHGDGAGLGAGTVGLGFVGAFGSGTFGAEGSSSTLNGGYGVYAFNSAGNGLLVESGNVANTINDNCDGSGTYYCGGSRFAGSGDVIVSETDGVAGAYAVSGRDNSCSTSCTGYAFEGRGNGYFTGSMTAVGGYFGPSGALAVNGSTATLKQGQAVTLLGVKASPLGGTPLLMVGPAADGDTVIGVVNSQMTVAPKTSKVTIPARTVKGPDGRDVKIAARTFTRTNTRRGFLDGDKTAAPGQYLTVVTSGLFAYGLADASTGAIKAGDSLTTGAKPGLLIKAEKVTLNGQSFTLPGTSAGYALGSLNDGTGRIAIFVSPH